MDPTEQVSPSLTWGRKQILFAKRRFSSYLKFRTMDKVRTPIDSDSLISFKIYKLNLM
jgi:hypothetical protein